VSLRDHHLVDGLVRNAPLETWMDTHGGTGDVRGGVRVEIQALTLASVRTLFLLSRLLKRGVDKQWRLFERELVRRTREVLFVDGMLWDGWDGVLDRTIRPNIFLAAYAYPDLLSKKEWREVFDRALGSLWLEWGGLASIQKDHPLFCAEYSGQDDRSYHRGDSWYWVNNLAALVLHRLDADHYHYYVRSLLAASVNELLWGGVAGHAAELSSASRQTSSGCFAQAWSAATLVELLSVLDEDE